MRISLFLLLIASALATSCSHYRGHNRIQKGNVKFPGGVYRDKTWDDTLVFKRTSFFQGAKLYHDVLITELGKDSPFRAWLGSDRSEADKCQKFYVTMVYKSLVGAVSRQKIFRQIEGLQLRPIFISDFAENIQEHYITDEMRLYGYKLKGFCQLASGDLDSINISLPGFSEVNILK